jgi:polyhydroxyalkanoate synthase subunit PhaC
VLSNGGHIAGIVNPPSPKAWFVSSDDNPTNADDWMQAAKRTDESWWIDWANWSSEHAGPMVAPPKIGSRKYKVLGDGPGEYVFT